MDSYGYERNKGWMLIGQKHEANLDVCTRMRFWVTDGGTSKLTRLFWIQGNGEALTSMTDWCGCSRSSGLRRNPLALFTPHHHLDHHECGHFATNTRSHQHSCLQNTFAHSLLLLRFACAYNCNYSVDCGSSSALDCSGSAQAVW